jgi:hypothetical protein
MPTLSALNIPMLWLLAGDDITAPPRLTLEHLAQLRNSGHKIQTIVFPHADHGLVEYRIENGRRVHVKYADGYFTTMVKWIGQQAFIHHQPRVRMSATASVFNVSQQAGCPRLPPIPTEPLSTQQ